MPFSCWAVGVTSAARTPAAEADESREAVRMSRLLVFSLTMVLVWALTPYLACALLLTFDF